MYKIGMEIIPWHRIIPVYFAHPVSPIEGETLEGNIARAKRRIKQLQDAHPHLAFAAPWLTTLELYKDSVPEERAQGLEWSAAQAATFPGLWLDGPRISAGMRKEVTAWWATGDQGPLWRCRDDSTDPPQERYPNLLALFDAEKK